MIQSLINGDVTYVVIFLFYSVISVAIILGLRAIKTTWKPDDIPNEKESGFGPTISVWQAASQFVGYLCPKLLLIAVPLIWGGRICLGQWNYWDAAVALGVVAVWPFQEWVFHVFLLHLKPFNIFGRTIEPIVCMTHRVHHQNPWNPKTGLAVPHIIAIYVLGLPIVWNLALPLPQAFTGVAISLTLILNYEWIHFLIHTSYKPRGWMYKRLWRNHRLHHFKNENYWYGVTMLTGDKVLRTDPANERTPRSNTCLTLGAEEQLGEFVDDSS